MVLCSGPTNAWIFVWTRVSILQSTFLVPTKIFNPQRLMIPRMICIFRRTVVCRLGLREMMPFSPSKLPQQQHEQRAMYLQVQNPPVSLEDVCILCISSAILQVKADFRVACVIISYWKMKFVMYLLTMWCCQSLQQSTWYLPFISWLLLLSTGDPSFFPTIFSRFSSQKRAPILGLLPH